MSVTGTDIRLRSAPQATRVAVAALLLAALAGGILIGRETASRLDSGRPTTVAESAISTRWLAETPTTRLEIMDAMNGFAPSASPKLATSTTALAVMSHMNELLGEPSGRAATALRVMRHMNELAPLARG